MCQITIIISINESPIVGPVFLMSNQGYIITGIRG